MDQAQELLLSLMKRDRLTESEFCLKESLTAYLEMQYRLIVASTMKQAELEGLIDNEELRGDSPTNA